MKRTSKPTDSNTNTTPRAPARVRVRDAFLAKLAETANVSEAAAAAGVSRDTPYRWRAKSESFAQAWEDALEVAKDGIYAEIRRRAIEGWDEPVYQRGEKVGTIRRYSDRLLEALARAHFPEFRENPPVQTVSVSVQPPMDRDELALELARSVAWIARHGEEVQRTRDALALPAPTTDTQSDGQAERPENQPAFTAAYAQPQSPILTDKRQVSSDAQKLPESEPEPAPLPEGNQGYARHLADQAEFLQQEVDSRTRDLPSSYGPRGRRWR